MTVQVASQSLVEGGARGIAHTANRMIGGIISYARWPDDPSPAPRTLCVIGQPKLADPIAPEMPGRGKLVVRRTAAAEVTGGGCDILFLGRMPVSDRQRLIAWVRGRPVLTLTDDDPNCLYGAMFCLAGRTGGLGFSVNLDAIGRGPLRIDPRVLKIGSDDGGRP
ncbi:MAG: YfiR family protein [Sphingopyxis sp.]|uniref:YfiR family protein n=1 Tax=Sphingopyxis sp. TaxID=1908224 RepID=UPI002ABA52F5|nr:YfiR family protein [Sphingopyxis sp.]MDZ3830300.1 YfiR family protein [Sphingopyxis sp.]